MKLLNKFNLNQTLFIVVFVVFNSFPAKALQVVPKYQIQCSKYFQVNVSFVNDFSFWGPKLNKFTGLAFAIGNGPINFDAWGYQVQRARQGDPVFWIFTLKNKAFSADVVLTQEHDWQSTAYGEISFTNDKKEPLNCQIVATHYPR